MYNYVIYMYIGMIGNWGLFMEDNLSLIVCTWTCDELQLPHGSHQA